MVYGSEGEAEGIFIFIAGWERGVVDTLEVLLATVLLT
jgi:hypothetical protein